MKKICLLAPSLQMGGKERAMSTLANYFVTKDIDVYYIAMFSFEHFFELDSRVKYCEPETEYPKNGGIVKILNYYKSIFSPFNGYVARKISSIAPDAVMSFGDWVPHLAMLSLRGKYPFYYANRSNPLITYSAIQEFIRRLAYKLYPPTGIIAQTSLAKERKERIFKGKRMPRIKVIPNPARIVTHFDIARQDYIIAVGRMLWSKGFGRVIDVFSKLNAPGWKLVLVGNGPALDEIKNKAESMGLMDRVIFPGKSNKVDEWLAKSKIYIMASYKEGFPNALCEAMAAGLACVSYDIVAGPRDIIIDGFNGYLVSDGDEKLMVEKTQKLVDNPELILSIGKNAEKIVDVLSIEKIGDMYLNFICNGN